MTEHVMTVTSATVPPESEAAVVAAYRTVTEALPHMVLRTFLVKGEGNVWCITTLWRSREQLEAYRQAEPNPAALKIFKDVGAAPTVAIFDVVHETAAE